MVVGTEAWSRVLAGACASGLRDRTRARHPWRCKTLAPRALARPLAQQQATAPGARAPRVMGLEPGPHGMADRPGGVSPQADACRVAVVGHPRGEPPEQRGRDLTAGALLHPAEEPGLGVRAPPAVAGERVGGGSVGVRDVRHQAQRRAVRPGVQVGGRQATPPHVIGNPAPPSGCAWASGLRRSRRFFVRAYGGSGRVSPCWARFPCAPRRVMAQHTGASRRSRALTPCAWHTWAARARVHSPVDWPMRRGDCGRRWRRGPHGMASSLGVARLGRLDGLAQQALPSALQARRTWRTV